MVLIRHLERGQPDSFEHVETEGDAQRVLQHPGPPGGHSREEPQSARGAKTNKHS